MLQATVKIKVPALMKRARCKGKVGVLESLEERLINSNDLCFMMHKRGTKDGGDSKTSSGNGVAHCAVQL